MRAPGESSVQAPRQCRRRVAVDVPLAGPVTLQPDFVRAERRLPHHMRGASRPGRIERNGVADSPHLVFLDRGRMSLDAVAVGFPAQEHHFESVAGAEMAPRRCGGEIDHAAG